MDARTPNGSHDKPASIAEIVAINIAWLCGLYAFTSRLMTQNTGRAVQGLALFFATFFYTLVRAYQLRRTDHDVVDVVRVVHVDRRVTDPFFWADYLPKAASGKVAEGDLAVRSAVGMAGEVQQARAVRLWAQLSDRHR